MFGIDRRPGSAGRPDGEWGAGRGKTKGAVQCKPEEAQAHADLTQGDEELFLYNTFHQGKLGIGGIGKVDLTEPRGAQHGNTIFPMFRGGVGDREIRGMAFRLWLCASAPTSVWTGFAGFAGLTGFVENGSGRSGQAEPAHSCGSLMPDDAVGLVGLLKGRNLFSREAKLEGTDGTFKVR